VEAETVYSETVLDHVDVIFVLYENGDSIKKGASMIAKIVALCSMLLLIVPVKGRTAGFSLTSPGMGEKLTKTEEYAGFSCDGKNISPEFTWSNPPSGAKGFAVTMFDPDARDGAGWWHWLVFDIPANQRTLVRDAGNPDKKLAPEGSFQSMTGFGKPGFGGPCPPKGDKPHAYVFTIYALDTAKLDADEMNLPSEVMPEIQKHTIGKALCTSYYQR
jgi:Raf kinase inhibitor-like YbhB/YbcL family protein